MPHFSFYQVVTDNNVLNLPNFDPQGGGESVGTQRVTWTPPGDLADSTDPEKRPLMCFNVDPDDASNFRLQVQIRDLAGADRTIHEFTYGGNSTRQVIEPFPVEWVRRDRENSLFFRKLEGDGAMQIRNVIVWTTRFRNF